MIERQQPYVRQIFMCINNRHGESVSCGYSGSEEIVEGFGPGLIRPDLPVAIAAR